MFLIKRLLQTHLLAINIFLCLEPAGENYIDLADHDPIQITIEPVGMGLALSYSWLL